MKLIFPYSESVLNTIPKGRIHVIEQLMLTSRTTAPCPILKVVSALHIQCQETISVSLTKVYQVKYKLQIDKLTY